MSVRTFLPRAIQLVLISIRIETDVHNKGSSLCHKMKYNLCTYDLHSAVAILNNELLLQYL